MAQCVPTPCLPLSPLSTPTRDPGLGSLGWRHQGSGSAGASAVWRVCLQTMGCGLGSAPWRPVRSRGSESTLTAPAPAVREGRGGYGKEGRPHPGRAPAGGGDRGRLAGRGVCGSCGRGLRPSNSRLLAPRSPGGRGGRTWRRRGGGAVTAQGGVWPRRGSARVRGCGSAGVSPGCVRVSGSEFVLGSAGSGGVRPGECWAVARRGVY